MMTKTKVKVTLTVQKAMQLYDALCSLDGYEKIIKGRDGSDQQVKCLFELPKIRRDISKNAKAVKKQIDEFNEIKDKLIKQLGTDGTSLDPVKQPEEFKQFVNEMKVVQEQETEVELIQLLEADLNMTEPVNNPIPMQTLITLDQYNLIMEH